MLSTPNLPTIEPLLVQRPWCTRTTLMQHQVAAFNKLAPSKIGALFMEMGTGKTRTVIELACHRQKKIDLVVWFCPVSVKYTIRHEILKHTDCLESEIYVFDQKTNERRIPANLRWVIIGIESMSASERMVFAANHVITENTMVIVDESTYIKGHFSKRTQRITNLSKKSRYRMVLTGTPFTQGPVDLFAQMRFLSPVILGYTSFYSFSKNHLIYSRKYKGQIVGTHDVAHLAACINPYTFQVRKKDCLDLPEKYYDSNYFKLSEAQQQAYSQAKEDFRTDIEDYVESKTDRSPAIAIFRMFSRLQSIVCGFEGDTSFDHSRIDALEHVVQALPEEKTHIVVWAKYIHSIDEICTSMRKAGYKATALDGRLNSEQRDEALKQWRSEGGVLALTQSIGGYGIDLTEAHIVIFYSNSFKYSERVQAEDRCHRIGQTKDVLYTSIYSNTGIEQKIEEAIAAKENVLNRFRKELDSIKMSGKGINQFIKSL